MRAPDFWWQPKPNLTARLLGPLGWVYGEVTARRMKREGQRLTLPVICVGNFTAGGAGKTPAAIAIARDLQSRGEAPIFVSRGYKGQAQQRAILVDLHRHTAVEVGDEALLLARIAPAIVCTDRAAGAILASAMDANVIILDDGLQNPSLVQDLRLAIVDGATGIGNGLCVPAGPLRAPLADQMASISAIVLAGDGAAGAAVKEAALRFGKPILTAKFVADKIISSQLAGKPIVAFAGIGLPDKFKETLSEIGAEVAGWHAFADHHIFTPNELHALQAEAASKAAFLITTEKDFVRLMPDLAKLDRNLPQPIALPGELVFDNKAALVSLLTGALQTAR